MITKERFNRGSGGVYKLSMSAGDNEAEFEELVTSTMNSIDPWASPSILRMVGNDGVLRVEIKYYGMD